MGVQRPTERHFIRRRPPPEREANRWVGLLRRLAAKYETESFVDGDPIRFLHTTSGPGVETMAFVAACLSYGSRKQFLPNLKDDVHVLRQARNLGLVRTNAATMRTALEITACLAEAFPGDPCRGDFALYGLGIDEEL